MKIYNCLCLDPKTKNTLVLEGFSYNKACFWLENELSKTGHKIINTKPYKNNCILIITDNYCNFIYDENRSVLMLEN